MRLVLVQPRLSYLPEADNLAAIRADLADGQDSVQAGDVLVLPERFHLGADPESYEVSVQQLARDLGCFLVAGSQHRAEADSMVHRGVLVGPDGKLLGAYDKLRPYAEERRFVQPGTATGEFVIQGRRMLVLICADFWFSDLVLAASAQPDLIVVPALSVSRKESPRYSQVMWRHLCVSRAYELGTFVGVSDWAHESELPTLKSSGVGGFADPTQVDADRLFTTVAPAAVRSFQMDFDALDRFRQDRRSRGFFWQPGSGPGPSVPTTSGAAEKK